MSRLNLLSPCFYLSLIGLLFYSCSLTPTGNPFDKSNTTITLAGRSSQNSISHGIKDSVGNTLAIGVSSNLPNYLQSVDLQLVTAGGNDSLLYQFTNLQSLASAEISWYSLSFVDTGTKTIYGVANIDGITKIISDTIVVKIFGKPPNHRPIITISGITAISSGQQCMLTISATDTDLNQKASIISSKVPNGAIFSSPVFSWTPSSNFVGIDSAVFIAQDNGYPVMFDTAKVFITVNGSSVNRAPKWQKNTLNESGHPGAAITITLSDKCADPDGDALSFTLLPGTPDNDALANNTYIFIPTASDTGAFYPRIVASDSKGGFDTLTLALTIQAQGVIDSASPAMTLLSPSENEIVSSNTIPIVIRCIDPSGVASVRCFMGTDTFHVTTADSGKYSATISGLKKDIFNAISFVAVDASSRANTDTLLVHIKYDSTITDNVPPIVTLISPSKDTIVGSDSCVVLVKATDASNIASVVYLIGSQSITATKSSGDLYTASVKGLIPGTYSTITITATDASPAQNKATTSVKIKCDSDKTPPTFKLVLPAKDSTSVAGNATTVQVICKDPSGVASLTYSVAGSSQPMTKSANADSVWSANITGLLRGQFTTITLEATDASLAANKASLLLHIKYDTTMADAIGPLITKVSGLADNARTANPSDTLVYTVTDASGVDTVSWSLNGTPSGVLTQEANGHYSIKALLSAPHKNTIVLFAVDNSPSHNKSSDTTVVDYNRPPVISGVHDTTIQELSTIQFTVSATDPESDKVTFSTASTLPTGAMFDATTGLFKWTVAAGQKGTSITFKANDGLDTATKTISIVVSNMPPPVITKNPVGDTVCLGIPVTFSVTASGTGLAYQWKNPTGNLIEGHYAGTTTNTLTIATVAAGDANTYTCVVTNAAGSIASSTGAKLTVNTPSSTPVLAANTTSVCPPGSVNFTITGTLGNAAAWTVYAGGTKLATQPAIANNAFTISGISAATSYSVKAEGGSCDNAGSPPTSNSVAISVSTKTVTFVTQGGTTVVAPQTVNCGTFATAPAVPTQTGYTFVNWCTDQAGSSVFNFATTPITNSITLYGKWAVNTYKLTTAAGAGGKVTLPTSSSTTVTSGVKTAITAVPNEGYTFANWTTTSGTVAFTDANSASSYVTLSSGDAAVKANFTINTYTLTVKAGANGTITTPSGSSVTLNYGVPTTVTAVANTGYGFTNWTISSGSPTIADPKSSSTQVTLSSGPATIMANFVKICTLTFDGQGGSNPQSIQVNQGSTLTKLPDAPIFTNCNFKGWFSAPNNTGTQLAVSTIITSDGTWYARWTVSDKSNNIYQTIRIGSQTWMVSNLQTSQYNDGTAIPLSQLGNEDITPGHNGALYNWYAINTGKLAPTGWRVPSSSDWATLINNLGNSAPPFSVSDGYFWSSSTDPNYDTYGLAYQITTGSSTISLSAFYLYYGYPVLCVKN